MDQVCDNKTSHIKICILKEYCSTAQLVTAAVKTLWSLRLSLILTNSVLKAYQDFKITN